MVNLLIMVNELEDRLATLPKPRSLSMLCARARMFVEEGIPAKNSRGRFLAIKGD
jgi:hypothetical protein